MSEKKVEACSCCGDPMPCPCCYLEYQEYLSKKIKSKKKKKSK